MTPIASIGARKADFSPRGRRRSIIEVTVVAVQTAGDTGEADLARVRRALRVRRCVR
jgi:hypothetical protein